MQDFKKNYSVIIYQHNSKCPKFSKILHPTNLHNVSINIDSQTIVLTFILDNPVPLVLSNYIHYLHLKLPSLPSDPPAVLGMSIIFSRSTPLQGLDLLQVERLSVCLYLTGFLLAVKSHVTSCLVSDSLDTNLILDN